MPVILMVYDGTEVTDMSRHSLAMAAYVETRFESGGLKLTETRVSTTS